MLRVFLNNTLAQSPIKEVDSINEELLLSDTAFGYVYQVQGAITLTGDDFDTLRALHLANYCQDVTIDIQQSMDFGGLWESKIKGIVKLVDIEWDLVRREAACPIIDDSYLSKISNNKSIEFTLGSNGAVLSKNGIDVSSKFVPSAAVNLHSPIRGTYFIDEAYYVLPSDEIVDMRPVNRTGLLIYDALNLIIAMMTDNEVDFDSDFFSYNYGNPTDYNEEAWGVLFSGLQLRNNVGYPSISFEELFKDLNKLFNVWFSLERTAGGKPLMRIEQESYFRSSNSQVYFDSVETMMEKINSSMIYSRVILGCSKASSGDFPIGEIPFLNHIQEEYGFDGNCNMDNTLDLRLTKLIISTNNISKVLPPISGFNNGGSFIRKFTTGNTSAGVPQTMNDAAGEFQTQNVERGFLILNTLTNQWSYLVDVFSTSVVLQHELFTPDTGGAAKDYEIYKPSSDDSLDKDVFLVQIDRANIDADYYNGYISSKQSIIGPFTGNDYDLYYYNDLYSNTNVLGRHMDDVGQNISNPGSDGQDEFAAELTTGALPSIDAVFVPIYLEMYRRIAFDDDFTGPTWFDTNGNYDVVTGQYTAPQSGYYHFTASIEWTNNSTFDWTQQMEIARFSQDGQIIETSAQFTTILDNTNYTFEFDKIYYLDEGDTVGIYAKRPFGLNAPYTNQYIDFEQFAVGDIEAYGLVSAGDTWFKCLELVNTGPIPETTNTPRIINITSDLAIDRETFDSVKLNPFKYYHIKGYPNYVSGYIKKITRNIISGDATISIFKKQNGV